MSPWVIKVLKLILVIGLLAGFLIFVPIQQIYAAVRSADPGLFWFSVLLGIAITYCGTVSMWLLARKQGIAISIFNLFVFNLVIRFYGHFSPASMLSTGMRWYKLSEGGKTAEALSVIAFHRILDLSVAIGFGLFWAGTSINYNAFRPIDAFLFLFLLLSGWLTLTRISVPAAAWLRKKSLSIQYVIFQQAVRYFAGLLDSIKIYAHFSAGEMSALVGVYILSEIIGFVGYVLLALALDISIPLSDLGWMRAIFFLASLAPFTMAGGLGLREVSVVVVMFAFGIQPDLAAAYSFLLYARTTILSVLGAIIELWSMVAFRGKT